MTAVTAKRAAAPQKPRRKKRNAGPNNNALIGHSKVTPYLFSAPSIIMVAALLAKPPEALRQTQALLRREDTAEILERMELENGHFAERLQSDEVKQAITAFFAARAGSSAREA